MKNMVADEITKEQAAKFIKQFEDEWDEGIPGVQMEFVSNIIQILFNELPKVDFEDVELEEGEADEILTQLYDYR